MIILIVFLSVVFILALVLFIRNKVNTDNALWHFKHGNVIVAGHKGTGKDLLFQWVINKRHDNYYANISYGGKYKQVKLLDVSCAPNDYSHIVEDRIVKQPHKFKEGKDIYISDIGVFLPSYMDTKLYQRFPSMPIIYALSRHLYNSNIHCNTQDIGRGWKALREQADFYIITKRTYKFLGLMITKAITYDKYESAKNGLLPLKRRILNKDSKNNYDLYYAQNGDIRKCYFIQRKSKLKYDTRAFEKIMLNGRRRK